MQLGLPRGIRRVFSARTGKVTFEAVAGVVHGEKIRKQFGEAKYGSQDEALEAAKNWYAAKREEFLSRRLPDTKGLEAISEQFCKSIEKLEATLKASEQRILEAIQFQRKAELRQISKIAGWLFCLSVEQGKNPIDVFEDLLTASLKGEQR
jgi:hypothetical protein